jgi:hypothetical protein
MDMFARSIFGFLFFCLCVWPAWGAVSVSDASFPSEVRQTFSDGETELSIHVPAPPLLPIAIPEPVAGFSPKPASIPSGTRPIAPCLLRKIRPNTLKSNGGIQQIAKPAISFWGMIVLLVLVLAVLLILGAVLTYFIEFLLLGVALVLLLAGLSLIGVITIT